MQANLVKLRKENNLKQEDLAKYLGIPESTYRKKESDEAQFNQDEMFELASYFNKGISFIFSPSNPRKVSYRSQESKA